MADPLFLRDLALVFLAAAVTTVVFYRLKLPIVLGYIVAGILISPNTPPRFLFVDIESVETISQIGLVFLLFALGLEWSLGAVRRLGPGLLLATPVEVGLTLAGGYGLGRLVGWGHTEAFLLGAALSISSTVIIMKTLVELGEVSSPHGRTALGVNVVEDLIAVALISLLSGFIATGIPDLEGTARVLGVLLLFVAITVVAGYVVVPRLVSHVARFHVSDVLVVTVVGLAFALALLAEMLGFAAGFGAFLAGFIIAGSERLGELRTRIEPLRDVFGAVFFVSIGMLVDPRVLAAEWPVILAAATGIIVLKPFAVAFALVLTGRGGSHAMRAGLHLIPIGEMGFVIAATAAAAGIAAQLLSILTAVALTTTLAGALIAHRSGRVTTVLARVAPAHLRRFSRQYAQWADRLARRSLPDPGYRRTFRRRLARVLVNVLFIVALFVVAGASRAILPAEITIAGSGLGADLVLFGLAGVLSVPPLVLLVRNLREMQMLLAKGMTPDRLWRAKDDRSVVARVVRDTVGAAMLILVAVLVLLAALPFFPTPPVVVVFGLLLLGATLLFFDASMALHARLQTTIEAAFASGLSPESSREVKDMLSSQYPWGVVFEEAIVPQGSRLVGRPLGELRVREETGATLVSIRRGERAIVNPGAGEMLLEGDHVILAGEPAQVVRARDLVSGVPAMESHLGGIGARTLEVTLGADSPVAGSSLREVNLRRATGAVVLALVRGGHVASHPDAAQVLRAGDRILVVGTEEQIERARRFLSGEDDKDE